MTRVDGKVALLFCAVLLTVVTAVSLGSTTTWLERGDSTYVSEPMRFTLYAPSYLQNFSTANPWYVVHNQPLGYVGVTVVYQASSTPAAVLRLTQEFADERAQTFVEGDFQEDDWLAARRFAIDGYPALLVQGKRPLPLESPTFDPRAARWLDLIIGKTHVRLWVNDINLIGGEQVLLDIARSLVPTL